MSWSQPDHHPSIQDFIDWVKNNSLLGTLGPTSEVEHPFIPLPQLEAHFNDLRQLKKLLTALFGDEEPPVEPRVILRKCPKVFSILLLIGKGRFIESFIQHDNLCDQRLPFVDPPRYFPTATDDLQFFGSFCKEQWRFCAPLFRHGDLGLRFERECILPITQKEKLGGGGSAIIHKITLHPSCDELAPNRTSDRNSEAHFTNAYVLKTYRTKNAERYYKSESDAFRRLMSAGAADHSMIGFYGSFIQDGTFNILLEYADGGTLEDYFQMAREPSSGEEILKFWQALFGIIKALDKIHDVRSSDPYGPQIFQGWHQDVKPANILVKSGNSESSYGYQFKLADLGLSHFKRTVASQGEVADRDSHGTRAYGAPECYRWDDFIERSELKVKQNVDIWSLGCVYSEAATWVIYGKVGLNEYRRQRKAETDRIRDFKDGDSFHNGERVLETVENLHSRLPEDKRTSDHVTPEVLKMMVEEMLGYFDGRPDAKALWRKCQRIVQKAEDKLKHNSMEQKTPETSRHSGGSPILHGKQRIPQETPPSLWELPPPHRFERQSSRKHTPYNGGKARNQTMPQVVTRERTASPGLMTDFGDADPSETLDDHPYSPRSRRRVSPSERQEQDEYTGVEDQFEARMDNGRQPQPQYGNDIPSPGHIGKQSSVRVRKGTDEQASLDSRKSRSSSSPRASGGKVGRISAGSFSQHSYPETQNATVRLAPAKDDDVVDINTQQTVPVDREKQAPPHPAPPHLSIGEAIQWKARRKNGERNCHLTDEHLLNSLNMRDHIFIIDDSASMRDHWKEVQELFGVLAYMVKDSDPDGIELYFTISLDKHQEKHSTKLLEVIRKKKPKGSSDMKIRLGGILQEYQSKLRGQSTQTTIWKPLSRGPKPVRRLNVYVFTDGVWQPECDTEETIKFLVQTLVKLQVVREQVGIQFIRFGDNPEGIRRLNRLDSGLNLPMDIVDHEPYKNGNVWKMLLGAINTWFDDDDYREGTQNEDILKPVGYK